MTYLNLVNNVLRRLREDTVTTVSENTYSAMVGDFVNDAKRIVEDSTDWSALRRTLLVTTTADIFNYVLTGTQNRGKILDVVNDTSNHFMEYQTAHWYNNQFLNSNPISGSPKNYSFNGVNSSGDTQVDLYPIPDAAYTLNFNMVIPQGDLTEDTDTLLVPHMPVVHMAVALAARERGETGGTNAAEYFNIASKYLSDAIALDTAKHPEEMVWYS